MTSHTLRHYFISQGVMSGTIIKWTGHRNTRMIEEVYGHLNDGYRKEEMAKLKVTGFSFLFGSAFNKNSKWCSEHKSGHILWLCQSRMYMAPKYFNKYWGLCICLVFILTCYSFRR